MTKLEENKQNSKEIWSLLKLALGKHNDKSSFPQTFNVDNKRTDDKSIIAESFNQYFSKIGLQTSQNVPPASKHFTSYMRNPSVNSMFLEPIEPSHVLDVVNKLKSKTSSGHDDVSSKLIKESINEIVNPLTHIINCSFNTGIVPRQMKIAKVIPIYKASDSTLLKNYRPISLLPAFSKIIERIMYNKLVSFFESHQIFFQHQYGFRKKHNTVHPIIHFLDHCAKANNKPDPELTLAMFCDLSKAFDVINHKILLSKLNHYGVRGVVQNWLANYLSNRQQFVQIKEHKSTTQQITCGVPQGSILGPILYLIYVNDIHNSCNKAHVVSFADDTTVYSSNHNIDVLYNDANAHINGLYQWFCANKLSLNAGKTKYIVIKPSYKNCDLSNMNIQIDDTSLARIGNDCPEKATKFLGLWIDENLSWKQHISHVSNKVARALFMIKQVKKVLPKNSLITLYHSLIQSHINYGIAAWGNAYACHLGRLKNLQKRALRAINNAQYNSHTDPLYKACEIQKIDDIYEQQVLLFMHDLFNNKLPNSFNCMFTLNRDRPKARETRQSDLLYEAPCKRVFAKRLPTYKYPTLWNYWATRINLSGSKNQSKHLLKTHQLSSYQANVVCVNRRCRECHP